ncbi:MAG: DinB family protein [Marmoricola sp.]|nr:DinB family protein [Marmoricola sp.]
MTPAELLTDQFDRVHELYADVVDGLSVDQAHARPGSGDQAGNPIVWLLWHAARIQDDHLAGLTGEEQSWATWRSRFGLPLDDWDHGYGHTAAQVDSVRIEDLSLLTGYQDAVHEQTLAYLRRVDDAELDRVVDERWDPPVTAGVRLVSVIGDELQHLGQAAYVKGLS